MNFDRKDWHVSIERINNEKGYTLDNVCLICLEFNTHCQWNHNKIKDLILILEKNTENNIDFKEENLKYNFLKKLYNGAVSRTKERQNNKNSEKRDNTIDITFEFLIKLFNKQKGLCYYSGIPLQFGSFKNKSWVTFLERKDPLKGYTQDNVCLICLEFQATDRRVEYTNNDEGNSGWTKEKFQYFLNTVKESNIF